MQLTLHSASARVSTGHYNFYLPGCSALQAGGGHHMRMCVCRQVLQAIAHKKWFKIKKSDHAACGGPRQKTEEG